MIFEYRIMLACILLLTNFSLQENNLKSVIENNITVQSLAKKWKFKKYKYSIFTEKPSEKEKDDFLYLLSNMRYSSISEGVHSEGKWSLKADDKTIILTDDQLKGTIVFLIDKLTEKSLVLRIVDPSDEETKRLKLIFESN